MSIPVTCPECQSHFHVGDEFAGQPGRCPECAAVIEVPNPADAASDPVDRVDPHPYWTPRGVEAFEELPRKTREPRPEERRDPIRQDLRDRLEPGPRFDAAARAAKWKAVSHGLRNLMVAVTLIAVDQAVGTAFFLADGVKEAAQPGNFGPREKSLIIGHGLIAALCIVMWMLGRIGCARVPYLPARRLALPAGIIAGMTGVSGLIGFTLFIFGFAMIQQGNLGGGGLMAGMGQCAIFPAMFGFVVTEILGVWSQIRIAEGLHDVTFGRTSKIMMVVLVLLMTLSICGSCLLAMLVAAAMEKANQKQLQNQQQPPPIVQPADDAAPPGGENKATPPEKKPIEDRQPKKEEPKAKTAPPGEARPAEPKKKPIEDRQPKKEEPKKAAPPDEVKPAQPEKKAAPPPVNVNNAPRQPQPKGKQQPPPELAEHPEAVFAITIFTLLIALGYEVFCLICFQSGRRAIRIEIEHLVGDAHNQDHPHAERY